MPDKRRFRDHLAGAEEARPIGGGVLPPGCPVTPLGTGDGVMFAYLNDCGHFRLIEAGKHSKLVITSLFATSTDWLRKHFPRTIDRETGEARSWQHEAVAEALMAACQATNPSLSLTDALRGRGVWQGQDGEPIVHLGHTLLAGRGAMEAGRQLDGWIYPRRPQMLAPVPEPQPGGEGGPGHELMKRLARWRFAHAAGPRLVAGWIVCAMLCGALRWRPHLWVVAPRGSGKSTLIAFLARVMDDMLLAVEDTTEAALRATLEFDALPIALDEQEPDEDNAGKLHRIINLIRLASSGGTVIRGTADHGTVRQVLRFCAIAASVVRPPLTAQDLTRITPIALKPLERTATPPELQAETLRLLGRRLFRRAIDAWPRFADVFGRFRHHLMQAAGAHSLDARNADQIGTLLAAAWVLLHDLPPETDSLEEWCADALEVAVPHLEEDRPEWWRCLEHLAGALVPDAAGKRHLAVSELAAIAAGQARRHDGEEWTAAERADAQAALARVGLRVEADAEGKGWLAVANSHPQLARLFERSRWASRAGTAGAWKGVLEQAPQARLGGTTRFGERTSRCVRVPLSLVFGTEHEGDVA